MPVMNHGYRAPQICRFCRADPRDRNLPFFDAWHGADLPRVHRGTWLALAAVMASLRALAPVLALPLLFVTRPAAADELECRVRGQVADVHNGVAIAGARVLVTDKSGLRGSTVSDGSGRYVVFVPPGDYDVEFVYGKAHAMNHVTVTESCAATLDGKVDATGEVIVIQDQKPPSVPAKPLNFRSRRNPPYSEEALDKDAWTRAWMLLDVSVTGQVTQFKFLKRPGYDLEAIAAKEVFDLQFEPARDEHGQPMRIWLVWGLEWPSNEWLMRMNLPRTTRPPVVGFPPRQMSDGVPCKGSGPMHLGSLFPTYRDCSTPDLSRIPKEPWIERPGLK